MEDESQRPISKISLGSSLYSSGLETGGNRRYDSSIVSGKIDYLELESKINNDSMALSIPKEY
jgi:hypothetical protein